MTNSSSPNLTALPNLHIQAIAARSEEFRLGGGEANCYRLTAYPESPTSLYLLFEEDDTGYFYHTLPASPASRHVVLRREIQAEKVVGIDYFHGVKRFGHRFNVVMRIRDGAEGAFHLRLRFNKCKSAAAFLRWLPTFLRASAMTNAEREYRRLDMVTRWIETEGAWPATFLRSPFRVAPNYRPVWFESETGARGFTNRAEVGGFALRPRALNRYVLVQCIPLDRIFSLAYLAPVSPIKWRRIKGILWMATGYWFGSMAWLSFSLAGWTIGPLLPILFGMILTGIIAINRPTVTTPLWQNRFVECGPGDVLQVGVVRKQVSVTFHPRVYDTPEPLTLQLLTSTEDERDSLVEAVEAMTVPDDLR